MNLTNEMPAWIQRFFERLPEDKRNTFGQFIREQKLKKASPNTIENYFKAIKTLECNGKKYSELDAEDLMQWMEAIDNNRLSQGSALLYRRQVKAFLRWTHGCRTRKDPTPEFLRCIVGGQRLNHDLPKVILTTAEVRNLIDACESQRDRALIFLAYETGSRASEILNLKIEGLQFDEFGAVVGVNGKTGERRLRIVESVPDLKIWLSMHPDKDNPKATLWPSYKRGHLGLMGFQLLLQRLSKKAGIKRHIHPHLLRHSRATHLATVLTEAQMRVYFGWTKRSEIPSVYVHLSGRDVDSTLLKHYGIKVEVPKEGLLGPKACPWCKAINSPSARFCQSCNAPLDPASASKAMEDQRKRTDFVDDFLKWLQQRNPEIADDYFKEKRKELEGLAAE